MGWLYLLGAVICEIGWSGIGLKFSQGGSNVKATALTFLSYALVIVLMTFATKTLSVSTAYPILAGAGIAGSTLVAFLFFDEPHGLLKILCVTLIFVGAVGLKFLEKSP